MAAKKQTKPASAGGKQKPEETVENSDVAQQEQSQQTTVDEELSMHQEAAQNDEEEEHAATKSHAKRNTLFVRSLPASATTESLTEFFSQSYPIKHATVVLDRTTKQSRGFGFVTFADHEDVPRAMEEFQNAEFDGKKIKLDIAEPRHREGDEAGAKNTQAAKMKEEREKKRMELHPPKLIIRNLPWSINTPEELTLLFRSYGKVKQATLPKKNGKLQGFGFVVLRGKKNAEKALEGVNGKEVDGRTLAVDWAVEKKVWEELQTKEEQEEENEKGGDVEMKDAKDDESSDEDDGGVHLPDEEADSDQSSDEEAGDEDEEDEDEEDEDEDEEDEEEENKEDDRNECTVFIRNLPFTATDEGLYDHFKSFGPLRYARVVLDPETERPRGTGFVCFWKREDCIECLKGAPRKAEVVDPRKDKKSTALKHSILEDETKDPSGRYTMDSRVLQCSQAVSKERAHQLEEEGTHKRDARDGDKRRLFLLSEGSIPKESALYKSLPPSEIKLREESAKQRQKLIKANPMLHLSLCRLSVRNLPRSVDSKQLKQLAREAIVGFAKDVKAGIRQPLSKEELNRGKEAMLEAERIRKMQGKGVVRQAKVVFESREGTKIDEKNAAGRSRGYGFIEYTTHRSALMGLRWLNGHPVVTESEGKKKTKRLVVEFAIENAQVVKRRLERENASREKKGKDEQGNEEGDKGRPAGRFDRNGRGGPRS
ncbi:RNA recognition motif-containing protein, partial [Ascosphaera atra]